MCVKNRKKQFTWKQIHQARIHKGIIMELKRHSEYKPTGDQPQAIRALVDGFREGNQFETLLGVTGSGKTFTMANVIQALQKPTLIISHNKTLAGQLYGEMKEFFPENAVEYFVSYYDYWIRRSTTRSTSCGSPRRRRSRSAGT